MESHLSIFCDDAEPAVAGIPVGLWSHLREQAEVDNDVIPIGRRDTEYDKQGTESALSPPVANHVSRRVYGYG